MQIESQMLTSNITESGWIIINIENKLMALSGDELMAIELSSGIEIDDEEDNPIAAWYHLDGKIQAVYCLNGELEMIKEIPTQRSFVMFVRYKKGVIGVLCDSIRKLPPEDPIATQKTPLCLQNPSSPIIGLAWQDDSILGVLDAESLGKFIDKQE